MSRGVWVAPAVKDAAIARADSSQVCDRRGEVLERAHRRSHQAEGGDGGQAQRRAGECGQRRGLHQGALCQAAALVLVCAHSVTAFGFAPSLAPTALASSRTAPGCFAPSLAPSVALASSRAAPGRLTGAGGGGLHGVTSVLLKPTSSATVDAWGKRLPAVVSAARPRLPSLSDSELGQLSRGERVQRQTRRNLVGEGLVALPSHTLAFASSPWLRAALGCERWLRALRPACCAICFVVRAGIIHLLHDRGMLALSMQVVLALEPARV